MEDDSRRPRYSVCLTNFNTIKTLSASLDSVLRQLDSDFEVVVVDNLSRDGSLELLRSMHSAKKIRLIEQKCTRGRGRQLAFEHSRGQYIIDQIDLDDYYKPCIGKLIDLYHQHFEGLMMMADGFLIAPRALVQELNGWRNLQWGEDRDFWDRAASMGKMVYVPFETRTRIKPHGSGSFLHRVRYKYERARDLYARGMNPSEGSRRAFSTSAIGTAAYLRSRFMESYPVPEKRFSKVENAAKGVVLSEEGLT